MPASILPPGPSLASPPHAIEESAKMKAARVMPTTTTSKRSGDGVAAGKPSSTIFAEIAKRTCDIDEDTKAQITQLAQLVSVKRSLSDHLLAALECFPQTNDEVFALLANPNSTLTFTALRNSGVCDALLDISPSLEREIEALEEIVVYWRERSLKQHGGIWLREKVLERLASRFRRARRAALALAPELDK